MKNLNEIINPPIGISHVTQNIEDLYLPRLRAGSIVYFHPAAQPNSHPHLGTVTTLILTFALAKRLNKIMDIKPAIHFWALENAPGDLMEVNGKTYYRTLGRSQINGNPKSEFYMTSFKNLLDRLSILSGQDVQINNYSDFQANKRVRELYLKLISMEKELAPLLCPSEKRFKVRSACPVCGFSEKLGGKAISQSQNGMEIRYKNTCFDHGSFETVLSPDSKDEFDINTPVRALVREALYIEKAQKNNGHNMMSDGGDWSHYGTINVECLHALGYAMQHMPMRFFAPVILDSSGAKLAKSAQVGSEAYRDLPKHFVNYVELISRYGSDIIDYLYNHASSWLDNPNRIFRNYSISYMHEIFQNFEGMGYVGDR